MYNSSSRINPQFNNSTEYSNGDIPLNQNRFSVSQINHKHVIDKSSLDWNDLMDERLEIDQIPRTKDRIISEKITSIQNTFPSIISNMELKDCQPYDLLIINDPKNDIYASEIQAMWNYFRLTDQTSLQLYPKMNHIKMPDISIIEKYLNQYNQLKPLFLDFLNLNNSRLTFIFNNKHQDDLQIQKHDTDIYIIKLPSLATKTDHFIDLAKEESLEFNLPPGHKIIVSLDICKSIKNNAKQTKEIKETKEIEETKVTKNKKRCIIC